MFKKSIVVLSTLLVFSFSACSQNKCNTYSEPGIGVTFCAPQGWTIKKQQGDQPATVFGETRNGKTPNINVRSESFPSSLPELVAIGIAYTLDAKARNEVSDVKVKSQSEFVADSKGVKVVYDTENDGLFMKSIQYYFIGAGDQKVIVTATLPNQRGDDIEKIVDASLKTFKIDRTPVKIGNKKSNGL